MTPERLLHLLDAYVENRLDDTERAELSARLASSPEACRTFWEYVHQHALLVDLHAEAAGRRLAAEETQPQPARPRRRPVLYWVAGMAASVAVLLGSTWLLQPRPGAPLATIGDIRGDVQVLVGASLLPARPGQPVAAGSEVRTGEDSSAVVTYADSSRLELTGDTSVRLLGGDGPTGEEGIFLVKGAVNATIAPRPKGRPMMLRTEQGDVRAAGGKVRSATVQGETRVELEGRALLEARGLGKSVEMLTGVYALVAGPEPEVYQPAPMRPAPTKPAAILSEPSGPVLGLAISPDGRMLAVPCYNGVVKLYDAKTLKVRRTLAGGEARPLALSFSPDRRSLAIGSESVERGTPALVVWDLHAGQLRHVLAGPRRVPAVAFSPDSLSVAYAAGERNQRGIGIWDVGDFRERIHLNDRADRILSLAFDPASGLVAAGCGDGKVVLCDPNTGRTVRTLEGHSRNVQAVAFQPGGGLIASGGRDGTVRLWSRDTGELARTLTGKFGEVRCLAFSPDGRTLATGHGGVVVLWDVKTGDRLTTLQAHRFSVTAVAYLPDGSALVTSGWDRTVKVWALQSAKF